MVVMVVGLYRRGQVIETLQDNDLLNSSMLILWKATEPEELVYEPEQLPAACSELIQLREDRIPFAVQWMGQLPATPSAESVLRPRQPRLRPPRECSLPSDRVHGTNLAFLEGQEHSRTVFGAGLHVSMALGGADHNLGRQERRTRQSSVSNHLYDDLLPAATTWPRTSRNERSRFAKTPEKVASLQGLDQNLAVGHTSQCWKNVYALELLPLVLAASMVLQVNLILLELWMITMPCCQRIAGRHNRLTRYYLDVATTGGYILLEDTDDCRWWSTRHNGEELLSDQCRNQYSCLLRRWAGATEHDLIDDGFIIQCEHFIDSRLLPSLGKVCLWL